MGSDSSDSSIQNEEELKRDFFARLEACESGVNNGFFGVCGEIRSMFLDSPFDCHRIREAFIALYKPRRHLEVFWLSSWMNNYWKDGLTGRERRIKYLRKFRDYLLENDRWKEFVREDV